MANIALGNVEPYIKQLIAEELGLCTGKESRLQNTNPIDDAPDPAQSHLQRRPEQTEAANDE